MGKPLRALIVEDVEQDAVLVVRELKRSGFDVAFERVDTPEAMSAALDKQPWDIVISDYSMPRFSGPLALALVKERRLDVPFIIVSGTVNEEIAVEAIHAGAHDFMAKGKLGRLVPAIERELRDVALRAEQKKMQDQLMISDRMASMGTLAAGVAHEINNPLAVVIGNLELAAGQVEALAECAGEAGITDLRDELRDAREASERVSEIVRDLKIFSRTETETQSAVDLRHVLQSSLRMAWNELRHRAKLVEEYAEVPPVAANEARLGQVFLNLIVNAAQAIPEGRASENEIRITTRHDADGRVVVEITDSGEGIPPEVLPRLFTPFFTTKAVGVGTGLGLSICHRIVTSLGGEISVESRLGHGTTVRVWLRTAVDEPQARPVAARPVMVPTPRGRILVVDDEPMIGATLRRALGSQHEVTVITRGEDALDLIKSGARFDLILCDLMMPQVTGMDVHEQLTASAPEQAARMVFLTGGAFTVRAREFLDRVPNMRIEKPFDLTQLRALVNDRIR